MSKHILLLIFVAISSAAFAQKPRYGIKTGLNVYTFLGGNETDSNGKTLDQNNTATGFQVGMSAALPLNDILGLQAELLYTQRGSKYIYEGKGFHVLTDKNGRDLETKGDLRAVVLASNSHIEIPILVYIKPIKQMRIEAGISPMILIDSKGSGEFVLRNRTYGSSGTLKDDMIILLKHDYIKDGTQQADGVVPLSVQVGGDEYFYNPSENAYYHVADKTLGENLYKTFDLGANLGVGYTFASGLAFNLRGTYGLLDATNNRYERKYQTSTGAPNYNAQQFDRDIRNFNVALTIGFSF